MSSSSCPHLVAEDARYSSLPDVFVDSSGSKGFMPRWTRGVGAGVVLDAERARANFDVELMTFMLHGGKQATERRRALTAIVENEPIFRKWDKHFLSRPQRMERVAAKLERAIQLVQQHQLNDTMDLAHFFQAIDDILPNALHTSMFIPTIQSQCSAEQQAKWLPLAQQYKIIGTYAQTELGHGSFVRGIETTATFSPDKQGFILHSPSLTSLKWWPGCLGRSTSHCIVMARLITNGKDYGVHAFILPLRDTNTYQLLPGIELGDIGPKFGYESNDNGYMRLTHVYIPLDHLCSRFSSVSSDGNYHPAPHAKLGYGTMVFVRSFIVIYAGKNLARAVTVATRYSAVRKQFMKLDGQAEEEQVLNYQTQQYSILPLLATCFAFHFTGQIMRAMYFKNQSNLSQGDTTLLAELHATSSGLKALTTAVTSSGIETCRKCLGGHGYSRFCGLIDLFSDYVPSQTYEGDNTVMFLQTARSMIKSFAKVIKQKVKFEKESNMYYMHEMSTLLKQRCPPFTSSSQYLDGSLLLQIYQHRSAYLLSSVASSLSSTRSSFATSDLQFDAHKVELVRMARAHCTFVIVDNFWKAIQSLPQQYQSLKPILLQLFFLYALYNIESDSGDFLLAGYLSSVDIVQIRVEVMNLLRVIRPQAVSLVDSFDFTDHFLNSALGRYDGDVYTCLYQLAKRGPINQTPITSGVEKHLRPLINQNIKAKL